MKKVRFHLGIWRISRFRGNFSPPAAKKAKTKRFYAPLHRSDLNNSGKESSEILLLSRMNFHVISFVIFIDDFVFFCGILMKFCRNFTRSGRKLQNLDMLMEIAGKFQKMLEV